MQIDFLRTNSEKIKVVKNYSTVKSVSGKLTDGCSIINPVVRVVFDENLISANYCYISEFRRYYFITDITVENDTMIINMHSDVLMNASTDIKNSVGTITRSNKKMNDITDPLVIQTNEHLTQFRSLGTININTEGYYILNIGGKL